MAVTELVKQRRAQVRRLREQGVGYQEIARLLGLSYGHVKHLGGSVAVYERSREQSRLAKQRRRGRCEDCGTQTAYNGKGGTSKRCHLCASRRDGKSRRGKGLMQRKVLAYLGTTERQYKDIRSHLGISSEYTSVVLNRLVQWGFVERVRRGWYRAVPHD